MIENSPIFVANLEIPDFTFKPNVWTETFVRGLSTLDLDGKSVVELGVGSGIVGINLIKRGISRYVGLDIDQRILPIAERNIRKSITSPSCDIDLLESDLLCGLTEENNFDLVCGCLPQVCKPSEISLGTSDSFARYFDSCKYCSDLNIYGLGLNESALVQSKTKLKSDGRIVLMLSGRPGLQILGQMFEKNGFSSSVIFEKNVPQLRETSLATLVECEQSGSEFYFYEDPNCTQRISVAEAEKRRLKGMDSYHKLYVIEGMINYLRQNL